MVSAARILKSAAYIQYDLFKKTDNVWLDLVVLTLRVKKKETEVRSFGCGKMEVLVHTLD